MGNAPSTPTSSSYPRSQPSSTPEPTCPVDPAARQAWLDAAAASRNTNTPHPPNQSSAQKHPTPPTFIYGVPTSLPPTPTSTSPPRSPSLTKPVPTLAQDRVISSIPRAASSPETVTPNPTSPNAQTASPQTSAAGNWIYPSEKMFFDAMSRKNHSPHAEDMRAVVPIHNAVNERAWYLIKQWEGRFAPVKEGEGGCVGPRLRSFMGDSGKLSPRARWLGLWGYERPFDRHDWVVERCPREGTSEAREGRGEEIEYLIDFYRGRESARGGGKEGGLNFYLDVRPKLNSWEGWRMRVRRFWGI